MTATTVRRRRVPPRLRARRLVRSSLGVPRPARRSLGWDLLAGACSGAYMGMVFPFLTRIARGQLGAPELLIVLLSAAPFVGNLSSPLWARQMEGRAKMPFVLGSWLSARSLLFLMPLAFSPLSFVALMGGLQFVGTISTPAYTSLMRDIYPDQARGRLMGYVRVAAQSLMFVATLVAGRLLDGGVSFRVLFPVAGLLGFMAAWAFSHVRALAPPQDSLSSNGQPPVSTKQFMLETLRILRENVGYRWFALSVFTYGFGNLMVQPLFALYQVDVLHISNTQLANLANFASLWSIVGSFFWGRFMDRHGSSLAVLLSICLITLIPLVYLFSPTVNGLFLAALLGGFGLAGIELSYLASILSYAEPARAAQYQSLHSLLVGVRGVLAPLVGIPLMKANGYPFVFKLALALMIAGGLMQWAATRRDLAAPGSGSPCV